MYNICKMKWTDWKVCMVYVSKKYSAFMVKISCQIENDIMETTGRVHRFHLFMTYDNTMGCIGIKLELFTLKTKMDALCNLMLKVSMVNPSKIHPVCPVQLLL
jgi:hypothetical protein